MEKEQIYEATTRLTKTDKTQIQGQPKQLRTKASDALYRKEPQLTG